MSPKPRDLPSLNPREIFRQTVQIDNPQQRQRKLTELCGEDAVLRGRVERLLQARDQASEGLLARAVGEADAGEAGKDDKPSRLPPSIAETLNSPFKEDVEASLVGQKIGVYLLVERIGQGGMGTVYRARQTEPVVRDVAFKVVRDDITSPGICKRFEVERQILAIMNHPHIAQVFDAGTTPSGQPYFVMELVQGVPITEYCQQRRLAPRACVELFMDLCWAVEHAHQKGAIHRDLKPANVLVCETDDQPIVKVIDFGVAKAISENPLTATPVTHFSQLLGTPQYMAPERLRMTLDEDDARSDTYSLGILLYELLAGEPPHDQAQLPQIGVDGFLKLLQQTTPELPSIRAANKKGQATQQRGTRQRGAQQELDWIVMKAIQVAPDNRYQTAKELASELQRFLDGKPISASNPVASPHSSPRFKQWWQRHRVKTVRLGLVSTVMICLALLSLWQIRQVQKAHLANVENARQMRAWQKTARLQQAVVAFKQANLPALQRVLLEKTEDHAEGETDPTGQLDALEKLFLNAASPQPTLVFSDSDTFQAVDFSPTTARLVTASQDGSIRLYEVTSSGMIEPVCLLGAHPDRVDSIAISPDGKLAASGSFTGEVWFWDLDQQSLLRQVAIVDAGIESLAWSPDGQTIAAGARYELAWVADRQGDELFRVSNNHRHESLLFSSDSRSLYLPTRGGIDQHAIPSGKRLRTISTNPLENVRALCWGGPNEQWLIAAERYYESVLVIDIEQGNSLGLITIDGKYPQTMKTTGDGNWLSVLYPDRRVEMIRLSSNANGNVSGRSFFGFPTAPPEQPLPDPPRLSSVWLASQSRMLVAGGEYPAQVWDWNNLPPFQSLSPPQLVEAAFPQTENSLLYLWDSRALSPRRPTPVGLAGPSRKPLGDPIPFQIVGNTLFSECGFIAVAGEKIIYVLARDSGQVLAKIDRPTASAFRLSFSRDGTAIAFAGGGTVRVWVSDDAWQTYRLRGELSVHVSSTHLVTDGGDTVILEADSRFAEYSVDDGTTQQTFDAGDLNALARLCLSRSENILAVGTNDAIQLFDRRSGELIDRFACVSEVTSLCFTPDDYHLLSGHNDGSIRALNLSTRQPLGVLYQRPSSSKILGLQYFPDGQQLFAVAKQLAGVSPIVLGQPSRAAPQTIAAP